MIINTNGVNVDTSRSDEEILSVVPNIASYLAYVGNVNADMVNSALGMNNEESVNGIGLALAMYAKYYDSTINIDDVFPNLITCSTIVDVIKNESAVEEINNNSNLYALITSSYLSGLWDMFSGSFSYITESLTSISNFDFPVDVCVIGAGGGGGTYARVSSGTYSNSRGGGGGAGAELLNIYNVSLKDCVDITIGQGSTSDGEATTITINGVTYTANGGGGGTSASASVSGVGGSGGTGGGGGGGAGNNSGGAGGSNGGNGDAGNSGGNGGAGDGRSKYAFGIETDECLYCGGGGGGNGVSSGGPSSTGNYGASGGAGGGGGWDQGGQKYGAGGGAGRASRTSGANGVVIIRKHIA